MDKYIKELKNGFTLIELLLYISIVAVVFLVISSLLPLMLSAQVKNQSIAEVEQQGLQVVQIITQAIRNAELINSPITSTAASLLTLDVVDLANDPTIFDLLDSTIRITEGSQGTIALTSSKINASDLSFYNLSPDNTAGTIKIQFTLSRVNNENRNEFNFTKTFYASASLRGGTGSGVEADCLVVNTLAATIGGGGNKELRGLTAENTCESSLIIDKITTTWTNSQLIEEIKISNVRIWKHNNEGLPDGRQASGTELDVVDHTILASTTHNINKLKFNGDMLENNFVIIFTLSDGSAKMVNINFADTIEPDAVADLVLSGATGNSIDLNWTAPGDDGNIGTATVYDIRYSNSAINDGNWTVANQATGELTPSIAGSSETMTVSGLSTETTYYFAIKTLDEVPNQSELSNVSSLATLAADAQADCLVVNTSAATIKGGGDKEIKKMTIQNTCVSSIVIDTITATWDNVRQIEEIKINNVRIWKHNNEGTPNGRQASGTELDVVDHTIPASTTHNINKLKFNGDMSGATFTVSFTMGDATSSTTPGFSPPDG